MKLYCMQVAPNPTKVMLYIAEKRAAGASMDITEIPVKLMSGEQHLPEHQRRTPFASLPVLEIEPGDYIIESLSIMVYLEDRFPQPCMVGASLRERARVSELERIADLRVLDPIGRFIHATNSPIGLPPSADISARAREAFTVGLKYLDNCLVDDRPFLAGDIVTIADCTLAAALQFARFAKLDIDTDFTNLRRWDNAYRQREPTQAVLVL